MKKIWFDPDIKSLDLSATASGGANAASPDSTWATWEDTDGDGDDELIVHIGFNS